MRPPESEVRLARSPGSACDEGAFLPSGSAVAARIAGQAQKLPDVAAAAVITNSRIDAPW